MLTVRHRRNHPSISHRLHLWGFRNRIEYQEGDAKPDEAVFVEPPDSAAESASAAARSFAIRLSFK
ncbi:MAG: hypothetical protein H7039_05075 [Bryobacteraceae bacterium]|nr:hypothetical protein [Bryobacteraceae bacterium]